MAYSAGPGNHQLMAGGISEDPAPAPGRTTGAALAAYKAGALILKLTPVENSHYRGSLLVSRHPQPMDAAGPDQNCSFRLLADLGYTSHKEEVFLDAMNGNMLVMAVLGIGVGIGAAFTGLGGGFLMIPILLYLGFTAQKAVGTSFLAILVISISALFAHGKFDNVDYRAGALLGVGGIVGAQVGARLVQQVSTEGFKKIFAVVLVGLAVYLFFKK